MMNLNPLANRFFTFLVIEILLTTLGYAIGVVLTMAIYDPSIVQRIQPLILLPLMIFSGFFINSDSIPNWLSWLEYISPLKYAFRSGVNNMFLGQKFTCDQSDLRQVPYRPKPFNATLDPGLTVVNSTVNNFICPITSGEQFISIFGMETENYWYDILIIAGFVVFFYTLSFLLLAFRKPKF